MYNPEPIADSGPAPDGTGPRTDAATVALLRETRWITIAAVVLLSFQLYGNLYEEIVSNVHAIAHPVPGQLVGPLEPGSPLYFYLPWVPIGLVLVFVLTWRLRHAPRWISRRLRGACGALLLAVAVKVYLVGWVNPTARDATVSATATRDSAILWAVPNGVAILAVATALVLLVSWRTKVVDQLAEHTDSWRRTPAGGHAVPSTSDAAGRSPLRRRGE